MPAEREMPVLVGAHWSSFTLHSKREKQRTYYGNYNRHIFNLMKLNISEFLQAVPCQLEGKSPVFFFCGPFRGLGLGA